MRELSSLILHCFMRNKEDPNVFPMSPISAQCPICLLNVLNICPMSHMSAQCSQFLPNVLRGQISDFFRYVLTRFLLKCDIGDRTLFPLYINKHCRTPLIFHQHWHLSRTTDTQRGDSLHCTAENSIPIPSF